MAPNLVQAAEKFRVLTFFPNVCTDTLVSHTMAALCRGMAPHVPVQMFVHTLARGYHSRIAVPAVPAWATSIAYRAEQVRPFIHRRMVQKYLAQLRPGDVCWTWPGRGTAGQDVIRPAHDRGAFVVSEAINCHPATTRRILLDACARQAWNPCRLPTEVIVANTKRAFEESDAVFSPSPCVTASMLENGIPREKILESSYGWCPERFSTARRPRPAGSEFTALFVGTLCVRKGAHLLTRAWQEAGVNGKLQMAGGFEAPLTPEMFTHAELLGHRDDVPALMAAADMFVLPTLEEGSPMVIYEAAAMGLPIITSPMGAGAIIRHGIEGIVLDPYDHQGWVHALRQLSQDADLRHRLGHAAEARAQEFTWDRVAKRRVDLLAQRMSPRR